MTNVIILAAGEGKRLRPLTNDRPKCLIEFHGIEEIIKLEAELIQVDGITNLTGEFSLSLTDFLIDLLGPTLKRHED